MKQSKVILEHEGIYKIKVKDIEFRPFFDIMVCVGGMATGKSYVAKTFAEKCRYTIVFDVNREYNLKKFRKAQSLKEIEYNMLRSGYKIAYQPEVYGIEELEEFCELIYSYGNICMVIEELGHFELSYKKSSAENFRKIINAGRHEKIGCILTSRRATDISPTAMNSSNIICAFQTQRNQDLGYLESYMNTTLLRELKMINISEHKFVHYQNGIAKLHKKL